MNYPILIEHDWVEGCIGRFPDIPGCEVTGEDMEDLMANVQGAVEAWAAENGITALPEASPFEPDFSNPNIIPMLVAVDDAFLAQGQGAEKG